PKRVQSKEQCDALIKQVNIKSGEISDLNAKLQEQGVRLSTSASGSQPSFNTRNDRILQTPSSNSKNKVEAHPRNVKSSLNKRNGTVKVNGSTVVQNLKKQDNSDYVCINSDDCMSSNNLCVKRNAQWILLCSSVEKARNYYWYKSMSMILSLLHLLLNFISQSSRGIFINQSKYALESLKKYSFESCDPVDTPMVEKSKPDEDKEGKAVDPSHYRGMIGTLLYLTASRSDL
ncbi:hypothetical protein Tco_1187378, partial [Tanacetum coccineum]